MSEQYTEIINEQTHLVANTATGNLLGGWGANYYRPWVYPFYAPSGRSVIQAFPHGHPWHTGIFVAQSPVLLGGYIGNFWGMPPARYPIDAVCENVGRVEVVGKPITKMATDLGGWLVELESVWWDSGNRPMIAELRTLHFRAAGDAHFCDITSTKIARFGAVNFPQTKFGGVGLRVEPRLTPEAGGVIMADNGRRGRAAVVHEGSSDFVAYENTLSPTQGGGLGVCLQILDTKVKGPWFVRDFGMAMYNPTWDAEVSLAEGEEWAISLRTIAYDGALSEGRTSAWRAIPHHHAARSSTS